MNIFEQATRAKIRFSTPVGMLSVEDLWDLPLTSNAGRPNLDGIAMSLYQDLGDNVQVSFVNKSVAKDEVSQLKFDIVKHIIDTRLAEQAAASEARVKSEKKQRILEIINQKEDATLMASSIDELKATLASM